VSKAYEQLINVIAREERVPVEVAQAYVDTENAPRDPNVVRDVGLWGGGSYGLMQITLRTARSIGFDGGPEDLKRPEVNLRFGLRFLRMMFDQVGAGSWSRAAAAYNAGPDLSPWPAAHVARFERNLSSWRQAYGIAPPPATEVYGPPAPPPPPVPESPPFPRPSIPRPGIDGTLVLVAVAGIVLVLFLSRGRQ
jgi:soluble lytic murein transglycosylase-like protein